MHWGQVIDKDDCQEEQGDSHKQVKEPVFAHNEDNNTVIRDVAN